MFTSKLLPTERAQFFGKKRIELFNIKKITFNLIIFLLFYRSSWIIFKTTFSRTKKLDIFRGDLQILSDSGTLIHIPTNDLRVGIINIQITMWELS